MPDFRRLQSLREAMQGAEVPVVLLAWMKDVEDELAALRAEQNATARIANRAESAASLLRPIG